MTDSDQHLPPDEVAALEGTPPPSEQDAFLEPDDLEAPDAPTDTEVYEGVPNGDDDPALVTNVFTERDGRTTLTMLTEVSSKQVRDLIVDSGMEGGMQEGLDALEQVAVRPDQLVGAAEGEVGDLLLLLVDDAARVVGDRVVVGRQAA